VSIAHGLLAANDSRHAAAIDPRVAMKILRRRRLGAHEMPAGGIRR
jgi:hypothetical protein